LWLIKMITNICVFFVLVKLLSQKSGLIIYRLHKHIFCNQIIMLKDFCSFFFLLLNFGNHLLCNDMQKIYTNISHLGPKHTLLNLISDFLRQLVHKFASNTSCRHIHYDNIQKRVNRLYLHSKKKYCV